MTVRQLAGQVHNLDMINLAPAGEFWPFIGLLVPACEGLVPVGVNHRHPITLTGEVNRQDHDSGRFRYPALA